MLDAKIPSIANGVIHWYMRWCSRVQAKRELL